MLKSIVSTAFVAGFATIGGSFAANAEPFKVDRDNYQAVEVARNFNKWADRGANNKLIHMTDVTPSGPAPTVRMNRDSLYSAAIFDTTSGEASITLPEGDLYQSALMVDTEGYARGKAGSGGTQTLCLVYMMENCHRWPHRNQL